MASKERTPEQIRAELAASRHAMTVGVEGLVSMVHPTAIRNQIEDEAKDKVKDVKQSVYDTVHAVGRYFVDERGPQWNNIGTVALLAGGALAVVGTFSGLGSLVRKVAK